MYLEVVLVKKTFFNKLVNICNAKIELLISTFEAILYQVPENHPRIFFVKSKLQIIEIGWLEIILQSFAEFALETQ